VIKQLEDAKEDLPDKSLIATFMLAREDVPLSVAPSRLTIFENTSLAMEV
jgi:hypothetical protein